ncbi:rCG20525, isoform CRA_b [Rattus norvegicus]|uniref:RCG20525, isoform CRA_b n=1 Tax=Rattus norvegicus TaxID=10116 RepID=A6K5H0_RAT|nr:rCG20525, isoform CRA_b [Rattus norvegicus]
MQPACSTGRVPEQPGRHRDALSSKPNKNKHTNKMKSKAVR